MPTAARAYLWSVLACGLLAAGPAAAKWQQACSPEAAVCLALAVLASALKVRLPGLGVTVTPGFVIVLVAAENLGLGATLAVGILSAAVQTLWRARTRPDWTRVSFNMATMAISAWAAHSFSHGLSQLPDRAGVLALAAMTLYIVNTLIVATMARLVARAPLSGVWRSLQFWTLPYYFAGGVMASVWSLRANPWSAPLCWLAALFLMDAFYREYVRRCYRESTADSA